MSRFYKCDLCGQEKSDYDLCEIEFRVMKKRGINSRFPSTLDVCDECLKKKGIIVDLELLGPELLKEAQQNNSAVIRSQIIEILKELKVIYMLE